MNTEENTQTNEELPARKRGRPFVGTGYTDALIRFIEANKGATIAQLCEHFKKPSGCIRNRLNDLKLKGYLANKPAVWIIAGKAP
jgi:hypothetical protein